MSNQHKPLPLSELIKRTGDDFVECHPLFDVMTNVRAMKGSGGRSKITLNIVTDKITPGDVALRDLKYTGFVILFPIDKARSTTLADVGSSASWRNLMSAADELSKTSVSCKSWAKAWMPEGKPLHCGHAGGPTGPMPQDGSGFCHRWETKP